MDLKLAEAVLLEDTEPLMAEDIAAIKEAGHQTVKDLMKRYTRHSRFAVFSGITSFLVIIVVTGLVAFNVQIDLLNIGLLVLACIGQLLLAVTAWLSFRLADKASQLLMDIDNHYGFIHPSCETVINHWKVFNPIIQAYADRVEELGRPFTNAEFEKLKLLAES